MSNYEDEAQDVSDPSSKPTFGYRCSLHTHPDVKNMHEMIDNPTKFAGGSHWSRDDKNKLKEAKAAYNAIQEAAKNANADLDKIDALLDKEKPQKLTQLAQYAEEIESKINEIDAHVNEYNEKINLLEDKTDEQIAWEVEARKLITKLLSEKHNLSNSLTEVHALQKNLHDATQAVTDKLHKPDSSRRPEDSSGPIQMLSADTINSSMAIYKSQSLILTAKIGTIFADVSQLFGSIFKSIEKLSSTIAGQFKSADVTLAQSQDLLNSYPMSSIQARL